ncbi:MAG: hypothetical protein M1826_004899 [Phylliscum demangeonii]|nr:MAG: hypothetical protein M1826_004899 [Phylliscum demangeonii]
MKYRRSAIPAKRGADSQEAAWVAQEDAFVIKQAKKKAAIRVKEGRAKPIDWLAVTLRAIDPEWDVLDDDLIGSEHDVVDPDGVFEDLTESQLFELERDIQTYLTLETSSMICQDRQHKSKGSTSGGRAASSVASDIDKLLAPKSFEELEALENQITQKLNSNEPVDVDYWEQLLRSLIVWKARATLKRFYRSVIASRQKSLQSQQGQEAESLREKLAVVLEGTLRPSRRARHDQISDQPLHPANETDPEPLLRLRPEDKSLELIDEKAFLAKVTAERQKVLKLGFTPMRPRTLERPLAIMRSKPTGVGSSGPSRFAVTTNDDFSQATKALYEREVARGVSENEEIFAEEEEVTTASQSIWSGKHRPRKPRYFNRVQMGYEWNKYNQTHYDHDNPPPKVVQGYKFNIFYPDLIDRTKAPTYRIERENGRKRGQSFAPAGEEDTCLIRFVSSPPYEDIAFRIVDKEWDYSAKRERGFRSSFDKGILQLHFQFKKIYYRK